MDLGLYNPIFYLALVIRWRMAVGIVAPNEKSLGDFLTQFIQIG